MHITMQFVITLTKNEFYGLDPNPVREAVLALFG